MDPIKVCKCQLNHFCVLLSFLVILTIPIFKIMHLDHSWIWTSSLDLFPNLWSRHLHVQLVNLYQVPQTHLSLISSFPLVHLCWWLGDVILVLQTGKLGVIMHLLAPTPAPNPSDTALVMLPLLSPSHPFLPLCPIGSTSAWLVLLTGLLAFRFRMPHPSISHHYYETEI